MSPGISLSCCL